jgi:hypothetical protein
LARWFATLAAIKREEMQAEQASCDGGREATPQGLTRSRTLVSVRSIVIDATM